MIHSVITIFIDIRAFIGHFHPVIVHLPIGMLLLAIVLQGLARREKAGQFDKAISVSYLLGAISAVLACVSGYMLSIGDDYDAAMIDRHFWFGMGVAFLSVLLYLLHIKGKWIRWQWPLGLLLGMLIIITGHLGGSLTHGSGYLTASLSGSDNEAGRKNITDVQEAQVYADVVQPLLKKNCYSCHNANKRKGGLQMQQPDLLLQGGKNGQVILAGKPEASELIKRMMLPPEHEDHMPPKEKPQPSAQEIALLHWWIASGASFDKKVKELDQPEKIKPVLLALQQGATKEESEPDIPATPVEKANEQAVDQLRDAGVVVLPVAQNSNYLVANFVTAENFSNRQAALLLPLKKQLVSLKLGNTDIGDSALSIIGQCINCIRLQLEYTNITDSGLVHLQSLKGLRYLNLVGTGITERGMRNLKGLPGLRSIYLYRSKVDRNEWEDLQKLFPHTYLDSGGYIVPLLKTDTTVVKYVPKNQ